MDATFFRLQNRFGKRLTVFSHYITISLFTYFHNLIEFYFFKSAHLFGAEFPFSHNLIQDCNQVARFNVFVLFTCSMLHPYRKKTDKYNGVLMRSTTLLRCRHRHVAASCTGFIVNIRNMSDRPPLIYPLVFFIFCLVHSLKTVTFDLILHHALIHPQFINWSLTV